MKLEREGVVLYWGRCRPPLRSSSRCRPGRPIGKSAERPAVSIHWHKEFQMQFNVSKLTRRFGSRVRASRFSSIELKKNEDRQSKERPAFLQVPWMPPATRDCSEDTAREIDNAVRELVQGAFEKALAILRAQRETLDRGARELLAKETLGEEDLRRLRSPAAENIAAATAVERRPA